MNLSTSSLGLALLCLVPNWATVVAQEADTVALIVGGISSNVSPDTISSDLLQDDSQLLGNCRPPVAQSLQRSSLAAQADHKTPTWWRTSPLLST